MISTLDNGSRHPARRLRVPIRSRHHQSPSGKTGREPRQRNAHHGKVAKGVAGPAALRARKEWSGTGAAAPACGRIGSSAATQIEPNPDDLSTEALRAPCCPARGSRDSGLRGHDAVTVSLRREEPSRSQTHAGSIQPVRGYGLWDRGDEPIGHESELLRLLAVHRACHGVAPSTGSSERDAQLARNSRGERTPQSRATSSRRHAALTPSTGTLAGQSRNQRYDRIQVTRSDSSVVGTADVVDEQ